MTAQAELLIDLDAYRANLAALREYAPEAKQMAVVKANAYGHGLFPIAQAARDGGADWLGVAAPSEALLLRQGGDSGPLMCWLTTPGTDFAALIDAGIELTASSAEQLQQIASASRLRPRVQLKVDTGLARNGAFGPDFDDLVATAVKLQAAGKVVITGLWSHLACADEPEHPANDSQEQVFRNAIEAVRTAGLEPELIHLANSAATITRPSVHFGLVRVGIASYGIRPDPELAVPGVKPVMTCRAALAAVKSVPAGIGVSYGWRWISDQPTRLGLVPVGYGDGIDRAASNRGTVGLNGSRLPVRGTICMDQFVVDLAAEPAAVGDLVTLFGPGDNGEPTAEDWAESAGTIAYEIVTRLAGRWTRTYLGAR